MNLCIILSAIAGALVVWFVTQGNIYLATVCLIVASICVGMAVEQWRSRQTTRLRRPYRHTPRL